MIREKELRRLPHRFTGNAPEQSKEGSLQQEPEETKQK